MTTRIPEGYHTVTPWVVTPDTGRLIDFATQAFDAHELARIVDEHGVVGHAEFRIGDSVVMAFDTPAGWPSTPGLLRVYVDDADVTFARALGAGGTSVTEVTHLFWGDRVGRVADPLGNIWWIQAHVEDVEPDEIARRASDSDWLERMAYVQSSLPPAIR